ncbi:MAG: imidazolonepropionase, partial [Thermoprotei archaeon]
MKAVKAGLLYTGKEEPPLENVYILFENSRIISVSAEKPDCEIVDEAPVVTPAFIDPHSHIGLDRSGEPYTETEVNEKFDSIIAIADALDSVYMDDKSFKESIEYGVLYSCILPGSGNIIGGKAAVIRNYAETVDQAFIKYTGIKAALGFNPRNTTDWKGTRPSTRMGVLALFRKTLMK